MGAAFLPPRFFLVRSGAPPDYSRQVEASTETELTAYLQAGDLRGAGTWLVERHAHEVVGLCRAMVHDPHLAEDLAQEVFGRAFSGLGRFRGEASPRTWLLTIARNRCIDHLRAAQRDPWKGAPPDTGGDPDLHPDDRPLAHDLIARRAEVASALRQLTEGERALVVLRFRHGLEYSELALVFGLKEGTVRMRMSRALSRMRRALQPTMLEVTPVRAMRAVEAEDHELLAADEDLDAAELDLLAESAAEAPPAAELDQLAEDAAEAPPAPAAATVPARRRSASLLGRLLGRRAESAPPAPHPLVAVLGLLDPGVPGSLRDRLIELTRQL